MSSTAWTKLPTWRRSLHCLGLTWAGTFIRKNLALLSQTENAASSETVVLNMIRPESEQVLQTCRGERKPSCQKRCDWSQNWKIHRASYCCIGENQSPQDCHLCWKKTWFSSLPKCLKFEISIHVLFIPCNQKKSRHLMSSWNQCRLAHHRSRYLQLLFLIQVPG